MIAIAWLVVVIVLLAAFERVTKKPTEEPMDYEIKAEDDLLIVRLHQSYTQGTMRLSPPGAVRFIEDLITGLEKIDPLRAERFGRRRMG